MPRKSEAYIEGLNEVLRAFRQLPKEASNELRDASQTIAERHMVPAWQRAALRAGPWGWELAQSVKAKRDRIPAVTIGNNRKVFSGGATPNMVRGPSHLGKTGKWYSKPEDERTWAPFQQTNWISSATYIKGAVAEWTSAVDRIVRKWEVM